RGADPATRCDLLISLGDAQRLAGDGGYRQTLLEAASLAQKLDDTPRLVRSALANHRAGWAPSAADRDDERIGVLRAALGVDGDPFLRWHGQYTLLRACLESADAEGAEHRLAEVSRLADELNQPYPNWSAAVMRANALQLKGELEAAEAAAELALNIGVEG